MTQLLHLDTSARIIGSYSRQLAQTFLSTWQQQHPQVEILYRDLGSHPIPHIDADWVAAYETTPEHRPPAMQQTLALSDQLINELMVADRYLISVPMYNLTVPSTLKAYLDQIVRRDRLFQIVAGQPQGALQQKKLLIITTRKFNYRPGSGREQRDFLEPFLREIWAIIGVTDVTFIHADQLEADQITRQASITNATTALIDLARQW